MSKHLCTFNNLKILTKYIRGDKTTCFKQSTHKNPKKNLQGVYLIYIQMKLPQQATPFHSLNFEL